MYLSFFIFNLCRDVHDLSVVLQDAPTVFVMIGEVCGVCMCMCVCTNMCKPDIRRFSSYFQNTWPICEEIKNRSTEEGGELEDRGVRE